MQKDKLSLGHDLRKLFGGRPRLCPFERCDHGSGRVFAAELDGRPQRRPPLKNSSIFCHECSPEAGRVLAEPPGNHVIKIGGSTKLKSCRPFLPERG